jgi:hypothetical protein
LNARQFALVGKAPKENISERHRRKEASMTQHSHPNAPTQFVDTANFAARDENIRCLSYGVLRKLVGLPRDLFADYWRDVLGPLCARLPGIGYYVQHHFSPDRWANLWPLPDGVRRMDVVLDGAAEIGFADIDDLNRYAEASPVLFADVFHLFEHIVAYNLPRGSHTLVDREPDDIPNGPDRLYRLHLNLNGGSGEGFRPWLSEWALASAPAVRKLRLHLPEPYDNARPSPPSPHGDHRVSDERKDIGVIEIGFASALTAREFCESETYRATIEDQRRYLRSVGAFLVSGVYTYVRDGVITTAGLRGSRTAELIERIGAFNQTRDEVTRRFVQNPQR